MVRPDTWPWITLVVAIAAFVIGMLLGRPRLLGAASCSAPCNCAGAACAIPVGGASPHRHCPSQARESLCVGLCTNAAGRGHAGPHFCSHGHTF